jgi:hypothetical protein
MTHEAVRMKPINPSITTQHYPPTRKGARNKYYLVKCRLPESANLNFNGPYVAIKDALVGQIVQKCYALENHVSSNFLSIRADRIPQRRDRWKLVPLRSQIAQAEPNKVTGALVIGNDFARFDWQIYCEFRAARLLVARFDIAALGSNKSVNYRKSQAEATWMGDATPLKLLK